MRRKVGWEQHEMKVVEAWKQHIGLEKGMCVWDLPDAVPAMFSVLQLVAADTSKFTINNSKLTRWLRRQSESGQKFLVDGKFYKYVKGEGLHDFEWSLVEV